MVNHLLRLGLLSLLRYLLSFLRYCYSKWWAAAFSALCLGGCSQPALSSFLEFIDNDYTAAAHLGIDRGCVTESVGQQLVVTWGLPSRFRDSLPMVLHVWVYYGNGEAAKFSCDVQHLSGYQVYTLKENDYQDRQGIISYKVSLTKDGKEILSRSHHLWMEVISLKAFSQLS
ncbi:hypothetical protein AB8868_01605 [Chlamydia trachomatis]|uniref:hypothetical protein n=1 Tax=Chlamydia trachomatis TaxID=813 RepID=UPI0001D63673|nr:hypothetical protein [Chlamydia trachomatis]ADH20765.1 hypothetical protein E11023_01560 [Chlamydia trachomatis E/11023]AGT67997.1 hypothetical protein O175_01625 [Chlamydia trachomatis]ATW18210.1 hypothetical protein BKB92_01595 [Chlamydia trachomatis]ATW19113.1 hypothetical protein BKB93_01595 [Chlamydia trachomatis]CCP28092.1 conserved hypothetical protein [Chlamydia trachomatis IU824]